MFALWSSSGKALQAQLRARPCPRYLETPSRRQACRPRATANGDSVDGYAR